MTMSPHDSNFPQSATPAVRQTDAAIETLRELQGVLDAETSALRTLDFAAIDQATQKKLVLESRLEASLGGLQEMSPSAVQREALLELRQSVGQQARQNQTRLEATLLSVRGLIAELTSDHASTYGPARRHDGMIAPVLTSSLG